MSLLKTKLRKKEFNVFEKSPLYRYASREIDDSSAVYDILGPLYIKNRMNFLDLFPDVRKMIIECNDLMKEKTENSDIYELIQKRNDKTAIASLRLLWEFVYNGYQIAFILKQYSKKRPDLPNLTLEDMISHSICESDLTDTELVVWKTPGFFYEQCIESLLEGEDTRDVVTDEELWEFFSPFFAK